MYLTKLKSYHIDKYLFLIAFDNSKFQRIIKKKRRFFPHFKRKRLFIDRDLLIKIIAISFQSIDEINIDATFKIFWTKFLRLKKIFYIKIQQIKSIFANLHVIKQNVAFVENNQYVVLRLKRNKIDVNHIDVNIILIVINDHFCLVFVLLRFYADDFQSSTIFLFRFDTIFFRINVIHEMRKKIIMIDISQIEFSKYNFKKKTIQHVFDRDMLNEDIQRLKK